MTDNNDGSIVINYVVPFLFRSGTVIAGLVAVIAGILYVKQDSLLYFPEIGGIPRRPRNNPRRYRSPQEYDLPFEEHFIRCSDGISIHAWWIRSNEAQNSNKVPTIIMFHGNAGNIGLRLPNAALMVQHLKCHVLMVEYRGYGDSDSVVPNEVGLKLDAEAALRFVADSSSNNNQPIFLFGRSLGGAVAIHLAHYAESNNIPVAGVMVENTFLSISKMVDAILPLVAPLKGFILRIGWDSERVLPKTMVPVLFLAGDRDELVPHYHMERLYELSKSELSELYVIENGTHNDTWMKGGNLYWVRLLQFMAKVQEAPQQSHSKGNFEMQQKPMDMNMDGSTSEFRHRRTSVDDRSSVRMGGDDATQNSVTGASSIPTMPNNLFGMAKEATFSGRGTDKDQKKE
mmetsp:Transcript_22418/g.34024  ORF Transcript_22418/g.34024 Transcript_22418/m.34024 type:complete len:401 (-) Transcript_22418:21-1223(-)